MKTVCAWCNKFLCFKDAGQGIQPLHSISHGICSDCSKELLEQLENAPLQNHDALEKQSGYVSYVATAN